MEQQETNIQRLYAQIGAMTMTIEELRAALIRAQQVIVQLSEEGPESDDEQG